MIRFLRKENKFHIMQPTSVYRLCSCRESRHEEMELGRLPAYGFVTLSSLMDTSLD